MHEKQIGKQVPQSSCLSFVIPYHSIKTTSTILKQCLWICRLSHSLANHLKLCLLNPSKVLDRPPLQARHPRKDNWEQESSHGTHSVYGIGRNKSWRLGEEDWRVEHGVKKYVWRHQTPAEWFQGGMGEHGWFLNFLRKVEHGVSKNELLRKVEHGFELYNL